MDKWWEFGLAAGILCALLLLASLFVSAVRKFPINWVLYILFTISFAYFCGFVSAWDDSRLFYFGLWLLTAISIGLAIYAFCSNYYMENISTLLVVLGSAGAVLVAFITFTDY